MAAYREVNSLAFKDTELTLGLPGSTSIESTSESDSSSGLVKNSTNCKRGFLETVVVDSLCSNPHTGCTTQEDDYKLEDNKAKIQVIGWPPVRSLRKKEVLHCKYVKVGADGTPYLRKIDLQMCTCYQELLRVLHQMFDCFTIWGDYLEQSKADKGMEYFVPTYEDRDGDLLLVGDVPWKMFIDSCKRIRLMRSSEANGLAP